MSMLEPFIGSFGRHSMWAFQRGSARDSIPDSRGILDRLPSFAGSVPSSYRPEGT